MILSFTSIDQHKQVREFTYGSDSLEKGFDLLSQLTNQGYTLLKARVREPTFDMDLPLEVFDGQPFTKAIAQLEQEWTMSLNQPIQVRYAKSTRQTRGLHEAIAFYENLIVSLEFRSARINDYLQERQKGFRPSLSNDRVMVGYEHVLVSYQKQLTRAYQLRQQWLDSGWETQ